jgi:hypothetical protein
MDIRVAMFKLHSLVFDEPELLVDPTARPPPRPNQQTNKLTGGRGGWSDSPETRAIRDGRQYGASTH